MILDNDGIPVEIQYLMTWHLWCGKTHCFSFAWKLQNYQWFCAGQPGTRNVIAICQARKTRTDWPGWHNNLN